MTDSRQMDRPHNVGLAASSGGVAGTQPKICGYLQGGIVKCGEPECSTEMRDEMLWDLVVQLEHYFARKLNRGLRIEIQRFQGNIRAGIQRKGWGLSLAEINWVMGCLAEKMSWTASPEVENFPQPGVTLSPCGATVFELTTGEVARLLALEQRPITPVKSVVDFARRRLAERSWALGYPEPRS